MCIRDCFYTTSAYKWFNNPLRDVARYYDRMRPHPLAQRGDVGPAT